MIHHNRYRIRNRVSSIYNSSKDPQALQAELIELEKELERALIRYVHAPIKRATLEAIKQDLASETSKLTDDFQANLLKIQGQIDDSIKGKTSQKLHQELAEVSQNLHDV